MIRCSHARHVLKRSSATVLTALLALPLSALPGHGGASADEGGGAIFANLSAIAVFRINPDGSLTALPSLTGTPAGLAGLAGF